MLDSKFKLDLEALIADLRRLHRLDPSFHEHDYQDTWKRIMEHDVPNVEADMEAESQRVYPAQSYWSQESRIDALFVIVTVLAVGVASIFVLIFLRGLGLC